MTNIKDIDDLVDILKIDMEALKKGFEENNINFNEKDSVYIIDYNLFINLTKKYCFKNKSETVYVHTSIIPPETESKLFPMTVIPVPEERLQKFKKIVLRNFDEKRILSLSYVYGSHSGTYNGEELYYRFFYTFCNRTFQKSNRVREIFGSLINQWNHALEQQEMTVNLYLPVDTVRVQGRGLTLVIEDKFVMKNVEFTIIENSSKGIDYSRFYNTIISVQVKLLIKIHTSNISGDLTYENDLEKYDKQYQETLKDLHLLVNALYINGFDFKWRSPVIHLPWWFNPELFNFKNIERKYHSVDKNLKQEDFDQISLMYSCLKEGKLLDKYRVILNSYFRLFQHGLIDAYFIIDASTFLEAMFTRGSNEFVSLRLRLNAASILAKYRKKFWKIYKFIGKIYTIRSRAVHGSDWTEEFEEYIRKRYCVNEGKIANAVVKFRDELLLYLNTSLTYLIEKMSDDPEIFEKMNADPLFFFNNSELTKKEKNRKKIIKKIRNNYINQKYRYENQWEEIRALFNFVDLD